MTLKFEDYLASLLRPLGVYDLRPGTVNRGELAAYGARLDGAQGELDHTAREMNLTTAEDFGLERVEQLLPYRPTAAGRPGRPAAHQRRQLHSPGRQRHPAGVRAQRPGGGRGPARVCQGVFPRCGGDSRGL